MLKINDRIVWRFKGDKIYTEGYVKEINGKILSIASSIFGLRQWVNSEEIEVEILEKTD